MISLVPIAIVVGVVALTVFLFLYFMTRHAGGFWPWQQRWMRRHGRRATGVVLNTVDRGSVRMQNKRAVNRYDLVVEVTAEGEPPFRVSITLDAFGGEGHTREGATVPVLVDPRDRERVLIDFDTIGTRLERARLREMEKADAKRRALLGKDPPA